MNYDYITSKEGYRVEDLSENDRKIIMWLNCLVKQLEETDAEGIASCFGVEYDRDSVIDKAVLEIQEGFKDVVVEWMRTNIQEIQISFAESEDE